jgi:hypothetical protein
METLSAHTPHNLGFYALLSCCETPVGLFRFWEPCSAPKRYSKTSANSERVKGQLTFPAFAMTHDPRGTNFRWLARRFRLIRLSIWILATIHSVSHPSIHLGIPVRYLFLAELKREIGLRLLPSAGSGSGSRPSKTHFKALRER